MTTLLFANNATSTLAGAITNTATTANLASGTGVLFPNPSAGQAFKLTFTDAATGLLNEIVLVTGISGDTITMVRAQEGTTGLNWSAGDVAANLLTAGTMAAMEQIANAGGQLLSAPYVISSTATITWPAGTTKVLFQIFGGGGCGGAAQATSAGQYSIGSGGSSGEYIEAWVTSGLTGLTVAIGTGGVAGANGGATTVTPSAGSPLVAQGGLAGGTSLNSTLPFIAGSATPSAPTGGYLNTLGTLGGFGLYLTAGQGLAGYGGGNPRVGTGGQGATVTGSPSTGANAQGYASGGGGSANPPSSSALSGGAGAPGLVIAFPYS